MTPRQQSIVYTKLSRKQDSYVRVWEAQIYKALNQQLRPVLASLRRDGTEATLSRMNALVSAAPVDNVLKRLYRTVGVDAANDTYGYIQEYYGAEMRQQKAFGFNARWAEIMNSFFNIWGAANVTKITENTRMRLRRILMEGQSAGIDNFDLAKSIQDNRNFDRRRSKLIARTETGIASSKGGDTGARQSGLFMQKTWLSGRDKRTRRRPPDATDHYHMNNVKVTMDEPFLVIKAGGFDPMLTPHAPGAPANQVCNCRCKCIYNPMRDANGRLIRTA